MTNELTKLLNISYPIIQAPMAGGITTTELVAAVSTYGGFGMIGAGYMGAEQLQAQIQELKQMSVNFGVNLFVPSPFEVTKKELQHAEEILQPINETLHLEAEQVTLPTTMEAIKAFEEQLCVVIEEQVPVCSFTFGLPTEKVIRDLKTRGIITIGTATSVQEAQGCEQIGMDAVVVQGSEAGGHRGTFIGNMQASSIGLMSLIPQVVDAVQVPVIAAGGIMDGRGLRAALVLGAQAAQMGTAFLTTDESGAHELYKREIMLANEDETVLTRAFSGKYARGIKNEFILQMQEHETSLPNFPIQNILTQSIRKAAGKSQNKDYMSLWSGQSPRLAKRQPVKKLMETLIRAL